MTGEVNHPHRVDLVVRGSVVKAQKFIFLIQAQFILLLYERFQVFRLGLAPDVLLPYLRQLVEILLPVVRSIVFGVFEYFVKRTLNLVFLDQVSFFQL